MSQYDLLWGRLTRGVLFFFALGLIVYELIWDHSRNEIVYVLACGLGGGPFASIVEALFTGKIQIQVAKRNGEHDDA